MLVHGSDRSMYTEASLELSSNVLYILRSFDPAVTLIRGTRWIGLTYSSPGPIIG